MARHVLYVIGNCASGWAIGYSVGRYMPRIFPYADNTILALAVTFGIIGILFTVEHLVNRLI